ncbi:MAG TPA: ABC transporter permease [Acidimicrobiia bacterium]|nr:ABC transporter permease [Acidimicrobiia bacterium]
MSALRVTAHAALVGFEDTRAQYTWMSWLFGWMIRATAQVLFFAAMGVLLDSDALILFAFIGNVAAMPALHGMAVGPDTAWERGLGTLPLLVAAPGSMLPVFAGRSSFYIAQGVGEGFLIFALLAPFLGFSGLWWWLPPALLVVSLGSYGIGLFLAAVAIRRPRIGNIIFNLTFWGIVAIAGVNVPTEVFPGWVQTLADILPLHHGLLGVREVLATGPSWEAARQFGLELSIGLGWFLVALIAFRTFAESGRKDGTIDLVE